MRGTAGLKPCFDYYCAQLDVDINDSFDPKKSLLRALVFNQESLEEAARNASHVDKRVLPWDNIYGPYKVVVDKMGKGEADAAAHLMYELAGPIAKVSSKVLDGPARVILGIMSLHVGKPWVKVSLHGSRKEFRKLLVHRVLEISGTGLSEREIKTAVDKEIKRLEIRRQTRRPTRRQVDRAARRTADSRPAHGCNASGRLAARQSQFSRTAPGNGIDALERHRQQ